MLSGQITLDDTVATQFPSVVMTLVALKADPDNTNPVWIGSSTVTTTTGFPLQPGETVVVAVNGSLDVLYGIAETDEEKVCYIQTGR